MIFQGIKAHNEVNLCPLNLSLHVLTLTLSLIRLPFDVNVSRVFDDSQHLVALVRTIHTCFVSCLEDGAAWTAVGGETVEEDVTINPLGLSDSPSPATEEEDAYEGQSRN